MVRISRCVCFDVPFAELRALAEVHGVHSVDELAELRPFGKKCGLCRPYVAAMLRTGRTEFTEILQDEDYREA